MFAGLRSRCTRPSLCIDAKAVLMQKATLFVTASLFSIASRSPSHRSVTRNNVASHPRAARLSMALYFGILVTLASSCPAAALSASSFPVSASRRMRSFCTSGVSLTCSMSSLSTSSGGMCATDATPSSRGLLEPGLLLRLVPWEDCFADFASILLRTAVCFLST